MDWARVSQPVGRRMLYESQSGSPVHEDYHWTRNKK